MITDIHFYIKNMFLHHIGRNITLVVLASVMVLGVFAISPAPVAHAYFNISNGPGGTSFNGCANTGAGSFSVSSNSLSNLFGFSTQGHCNGATGYAILVLGIINHMLVPLIFAIAFIVFVWGMFKYFIAGGANPEERVKGWKLLMYGLIGFAVMISVWGLVNIILHTFNLSDVAPPYPYI